MYKYTLLLILLPFAFGAKAQTVNVVKTPNAPVIKAIDVEPEFPGGSKAFYKYISKNANFPADASPADLQGIVTISMAIEKDGRITEVRVVKGISDVIDKETLRVINASPRWKPGMQHGNPIRVRYTFHINYALIGKKK